MQQGPFAPRALPRFNATTDPAATVSSSTVFPGPPVMRSTLLRRFLDGTRTASPVAWHVLVTVLRYNVVLTVVACQYIGSGLQPARRLSGHSEVANRVMTETGKTASDF